MIEKMKFVSITGPREDIDRVVNNYLSRYEIHLENALTELTDVKNLSPYLEINPYKDKNTKQLRNKDLCEPLFPGQYGACCYKAPPWKSGSSADISGRTRYG